MNSSTLDPQQDAQLYVSTVKSFVSYSEDQLADQLNIVKAATSKSKPYYNTTHNLLNILLVNTYPGTIPYPSIYNLAELILSDSEPVEEVTFNEFFAIPNETSLIATANDLLHDINARAQSLGFNYSSNLSNTENLLHFLQAKTLHLSQFHNVVDEIDGLFENAHFDELRRWYKGIIRPYGYYWIHYGMVYQSTHASFQDYLRARTLSAKFGIFIAPLSSNEIRGIGTWFKSTILPLLEYFDFDLTILKDWMFHEEHKGSVFRKYELWHETIKLLTEKVDSSKLDDITKEYLASCYYYAFNGESSTVSSIELTKIYDIIIETLSYFPTHSSPTPDLNLKEILHFDKFEAFLHDSNPLSPLFDPSQTEFLSQALKICQRLYPLNKLTLEKYLQYKFGIGTVDFQKEVTVITSSISASNWEQLIHLVRVFENEFITSEQKPAVDSVLLERLLSANLYQVIDTLFEEEYFQLTRQELYDLVFETFWDRLNQATNFNESIGSLHHAKQLLEFLQKLSRSDGLNEKSHKGMVRFKHLFRAMNSMKNFKLVYDKKKPFTPKDLLQFSADSNQGYEQKCIQLIMVILEHNPKSYLAFEKLFRILNDLLLYFNEEDGEKSDTSGCFNRLKSACIESALIDNNFQYAYKQSMELIDHFAKSPNIEEFWLTFYQVGKYVSPNWADDDSESNRLETLIKQREVLSRTLEKIDCDGHVKIILDQWNKLNEKIEKEFSTTDVLKIAGFEPKNDYNGPPLSQVERNIARLPDKAGEKISNLFVSGLGWAIGANK
ncbi:hypothetical protein CANMA_003057 [Candida margitis]|uniref:uncharacterized protein n=1 Tax=Candida margitis TaxID=1775924 RepID=UPI002227B8D9|nr:uncharacterized protein CANMA_003057 [Candida margitis]KAI5967414.1 hypothetical protein CANMA_003057 [Candida margitis]